MLNIINHLGNAIKASERYHFTRPRKVIKKKVTKIIFWKVDTISNSVEKSEPSYIADGKAKWCS